MKRQLRRLRLWAGNERVSRASQLVNLGATTRNFFGSSNPVRKSLKFSRPELSYLVPDNYTDETTFLDHLQRNPRLQPYEFWSLMADATVIVQHLASVIIFCCCFVAIIHGRVSPLAVVGWASVCTVLAWFLWDHWMGQELEATAHGPPTATSNANETASGTSAALSLRVQQRLATAKSALLIYAALLGLSPILKSLTRSTTSDSIWALSTWLLLMNVAFFDYGGDTGARYGPHGTWSSC
jgi:hypothetical protein